MSKNLFTLDELELEDQQSTLDSENETRYLIFKIATENYGFNISNVLEIISYQELTKLPEMPHYQLGVFSLRGQMIPVYDLRSRFQLEPITPGERTCIVVLSIENETIGITVDEVLEVVNIGTENRLTSTAERRTNSEFVDGFGRIKDQVIILLDETKLLC